MKQVQSKNTQYTAKVVPQDQPDKIKAPSTRFWGSQGQEQEGSGRHYDRISDIFIFFISTLCSSSQGVP